MMQHKNKLGYAVIEFVHRFTSMGLTATGVMNLPKERKKTFEDVALYIRRLHSNNAKDYTRLGENLWIKSTKILRPKIYATDERRSKRSKPYHYGCLAVYANLSQTSKTSLALCSEA